MNSNLNTLLAAIIDALASAVAEKIVPTLPIPVPTPIDMDALTESVTGSDAFDDKITSQVEEHVTREIEYYMEHNADIEAKVESALGDMDLIDYMDVGDLAKQVAESDTLRGAIDQEVRDRVDAAMENFDAEDAVDRYLTNNDAIITDSVESYLVDNLGEKVKESVKEFTDAVMLASVNAPVFDEMKVRALVREEIHAVFSSVTRSINTKE